MSPSTLPTVPFRGAGTASPIVLLWFQPRRRRSICRVPLQLDSVVQDGRRLELSTRWQCLFRQKGREPEAWDHQASDSELQRKAHVAEKAPWDGGVVWAHDEDGHLDLTACQGTVRASGCRPRTRKPDEPDSQRSCHDS